MSDDYNFEDYEDGECPACDGRGWFLINPFATGGGNGCGGDSNIKQCGTCLQAYNHAEKDPEGFMASHGYKFEPSVKETDK